ncbi:maleylpyruvate isomerase family mycothiol-dependent enzyme [Ornithinimicrobium pratense]|uniref:Maleylpyruvate isomerase family mycothiol-dependent enzyme n=2 Tax=Ornithinimicrobium pratense TaxID=2593973 RepID=A0A5J6V963_9MICO|nr:maleylpyruvate isomerase family mycothiol-dependent enzyme [Ornithinimicrobium pratense]
MLAGGPVVSVVGMVVHPSPPADVPSLIEAYRTVLGGFVDTCDGLRPAEWDLPTACAGWTARDHLAHVVHIEDQLTGGEHPISGWADGSRSEQEEIEVGRPEHVRNSFGVWIEEGVRARAEHSPEDLLAELRGLIDVRVAQMYDPDLELDTSVRSVQGDQMPFGKLTVLRLCDVWVHTQDIRGVVDRPGLLDSPGAVVFTAAVLGALPDVVARRIDPPAGTVVILESTGPVTGRGGVRITTDTDGEQVAHELFTGHVEEHEEGDAPAAEDQPEESVTTISLSTHELTRRAAGRQSTQETAYHVHGDEDLARQVLDALVLTP